MDIIQLLPDSDSVSELSGYKNERFFQRHEPISRDACDKYAADIAGDVHPTPVQEEASYTLMAADGSKVVQFRTPRSPIDIESLNLARDMYGSIFVPGCENHGVLGHLRVYVMDFVPGEALLTARKQLFRSENACLLAVTIQDYATSANL
jgi:hypothetical protein